MHTSDHNALFLKNVYVLLFKADGTPKAYLSHMHIYSNLFQLHRCYIYMGTYM